MMLVVRAANSVRSALQVQRHAATSRCMPAWPFALTDTCAGAQATGCLAEPPSGLWWIQELMTPSV